MSTEILHKAAKKRLVPELRFPEFEDNWVNTILGELADINPKNGNLPDNFIYIDLESVNNGILEKENLISKEDAPSRAQRILKKDDILYQTVRPYQKNNLYFDKNSGNYIASTGYAQLRTKSNSKFLYQLLHTDKFVYKVLLRCTGTSYPSINSSDLSEISISIPKLPEQQKIASFLSAVDEKTQQLIRKKELLEQYKKGVMQQLFSGKLRFKPDLSGVEGDDKSKDFPEWEEKKIKDVFDFKQGIQCDVDKQFLEFENGLIRFIRIVDLTKSDEPIRYINDPGNEHHINNDDLFMVRYGNAGMIGYNFSGVIANNLFRIIPKNSINIINKFYFFVFKSKIRKLEALASSSTMPALNFKALESLVIPFPCKEEQKKIADFLSSIDVKIENVNQQVNQAQNFKKGLLQQLFV